MGGVGTEDPPPPPAPENEHPVIAPGVAPVVDSNAAERMRGGMVRAEPPTADSPLAADLLALICNVMLLASFLVRVMLVTWIDPNFWPAVA